MRFRPALLLLGLVVGIGVGMGSGLTATAGFAADPTPTATAAVPVSVTIPGPTGTSTPSPSSSSGGGGGSGTGGGGSTPTAAPTPAPTGAPVPPAQPTDGAEDLTLDRDSVSANEWIVATGTGFQPGEQVQFVLYPGAIVIGSFVADSGGLVTARFKITDQARPGNYTVEATGWQSGRVANAQFGVVAPGDAGVFPFLWWVVVVVGVLLAAILATAVYFRRSIRSSMSGGVPATEGT